ncbi:MAG: SH3 domain-containing protein [Clostridiaceae bacterium]|nr:SH3 domain-containing protein [Clostridiaceae bacterium]
MKERKKLFLSAGIIVFAATLFFLISGKRDQVAEASAVGIVKVEGSLNVRTGPGTGYSNVTSGGSNVTLSNGTKVTITGKNGEWYHVKFQQNSKTITGYVYKSYVTVQTGTVRTKIYGLTVTDKTTVRKKASSSAASLKVSKKAVSLEKNQKVRILSESLVKGEKWYRISFTYNKTTCKGYVPSAGVAPTCGTGLPAILKSSAAVTLKKTAGGDTAVKSGQKTVSLKNGKQMTILGQVTISSQKYLYVKVKYNKKTVKGYLEDAVVFLQIVKSEKTSTAATASPTATASPAATASASSTGTAAVTETEEEYKAALKKAGFPDSYLSSLWALHQEYPNWEFTPYVTGLKWSTVIKNESKVGLNLLSVNKSYAWKSTDDGAYDWTTDTYVPFDGSTWVTASKKAVKYYMDPRNFLDERGIFQFESLEYQSDFHSQSGVENILKNTPMYNTKFSYTDDEGTTQSIKYSKAFMDAAEYSQVSPYHLAARVKQEVVISSTLMSSSVSGNVSGYTGIYNFYNIGANNSTTSGGAIANGLSWASSGTTYLRPWNTPYKSIVGGASYIGKNYINVGQNTLYLQKFNVTSKNRYSHQYMANIEAPNSEATKTNTAYGSDKADMPLVFSIPVYKNMPSSACAVPSGGKNPNNYLKKLYVTDQTFTTKFKLGDDGSTVYKLTVANSVKSIEICAKSVNSSATISGTGTKNLSVGTKTYTVKVTSESGSVRKYKIKVTRKAK